MNKEIKQTINKVKNFKQFVNESENKTSLDIWKELMDKYDLIYYKQFQSLSKSELEQMRENWKAMRRFSLSKLNKELNDSGKNGQLLNIDVSDEELYPYLDDKNKTTFFKYSRILDFSDGYKPKDFVIIKK
jgi:hypothetical protein